MTEQKWTKEESDLINQSIRNHYNPLDDLTNSKGVVDFEGEVLTKIAENEYKVYDWEFEEVFFAGTLVECLNFILRNK